MLSGFDRSVLAILAWGLVLYVTGLTLLPVVMLSLIGLPIGVLGLLVVGAALLLTGRSEQESAWESGAAMILMLLGWAALPVGGVGVLEHIAQWLLQYQRTGVTAVADPLDLAKWMLLTIAAATAIAGGLRLRMQWPLWLCAAVWLALLGPVPLAACFLIVFHDTLPLTA